MYYQHCFAVGFQVNCVEDRAGTVTGPLSVHYYAGKAAVIRATDCIQAELDLQGYRVAYVSGTAETDIAGSLSYYFDNTHRLRRIAFNGTTGDARRLVSDRRLLGELGSLWRRPERSLLPAEWLKRGSPRGWLQQSRAGLLRRKREPGDLRGLPGRCRDQ